LKEIQILSLLCITGAAVLLDLQKGRIPNAVTVIGILWGASYQIFDKGIMGLFLFLGGVILPVVLFGGFYFFRMIGAGDIKLMCAVGGFLGPSACFSCITTSVLFGGIISLAIIIRRRNFSQRIIYLSDYMDRYSREKQWRSYLTGAKEDARFCFSVPVLLGVLCYIGGII